ncbi:MAG TPA: hypothetical protein PK090_08235 [Smithellaceae bacterium]|nr:hypothetical protein [Smithellaceae bacterium]
MENLIMTEFCVPLNQLMLLLGIMTVALLFGYAKFGLMACYGFLFYWANVFSIRSTVENSDPSLATSSFLFLGFSLVIIFLALVGFLLHKQ